LFNSNLNKREEIVGFRVNDPNVQVVDSEGKLVENMEVSLVWSNTDGGYLKDFSQANLSARDRLGLAFSEDSYELLFQVQMSALSMQSFTIRLKTEKSEENNSNSVDLYSKEFDTYNQNDLSNVTNQKLFFY
jgi:hypothetical protein